MRYCFESGQLLFRLNKSHRTMSSSSEDLKPKAKRRPVRTTGLALVVLSFQTLGRIALFLTNLFLT
jgi:hypothetical protein